MDQITLAAAMIYGVCVCVSTPSAALRALSLNTACLEIRFSIGKHHLTRRAITLTCGVRQLLSPVLGLRILLNSWRRQWRPVPVLFARLRVSEYLSKGWRTSQLKMCGLSLDFNTILIMHETVNTAPHRASKPFSPIGRSVPHYSSKLFCLDMATAAICLAVMT